VGELMCSDWTYGWQFDAACRGEDSSLFFAPNYFERREEKDDREARAKSICARCPVRSTCLDYALRTRETHGIWGGLNELERRQLLRHRAFQAG
jgi:WhiB family redox-sensing transcriptional regulator